MPSAPSPPMPTAPTLEILEGEQELQFRLEGIPAGLAGGPARSLHETISWPQAEQEELAQAIDRLEQAVYPNFFLDPEPERVAEAGEALGGLLGQLLPERIRPWLLPLNLRLQCASRCPWELAQLPSGALWKQTHVLRASSSHRNFKTRPPRKLRNPLRAVCFSNSDGLAPQQDRVVEDVCESLQGSWNLDRYRESEATTGNFSKALNSGNYTLLLLALDLDLQGDLRFFDAALSSRLLSQSLLGAAPNLILSVYAYPMPGQQSQACRLAASNWASTFQALGTQVSLFNLWDAPRLGELFARTLQHWPQAQSFLDALQRARLAALPGDLYGGEQSVWIWGEEDVRLPRTLGAKSVGLPTAAHALRGRFRLEIRDGPDEGRSVTILATATQEICLGGKGMHVNDVELSEPGLENQLCTLQPEPTRLLLSNSGHDPQRVRVNGLGLSESILLFGGEVLTLGSTELFVIREEEGHSDEPSPATPEKSWKYRLRVLRGEDAGKTLELGNEAALVGRSVECSLTLTDPTVSRMHLKVRAREEGFYLVSLSDFTAVNGIVLDRERELNEGDRIQLSESTELVFEEDSSS